MLRVLPAQRWIMEQGLPFGPQTVRCAAGSDTGGGATGGSRGRFCSPGRGLAGDRLRLGPVTAGGRPHPSGRRVDGGVLAAVSQVGPPGAATPGAGHHRPIPRSGSAPTHPNEHLRQFADISEEIAPYLFVRTFTVIELDEPVLVTVDEPVVVIGEAGRRLAALRPPVCCPTRWPSTAVGTAGLGNVAPGRVPRPRSRTTAS